MTEEGRTLEGGGEGQGGTTSGVMGESARMVKRGERAVRKGGGGEEGEGSGGWSENEGSLSTSTVNRSFLIPHRSYETTTEKEEMKDEGGTLSDLWREEREACMLIGRGGEGGLGRG